LLLDTTLVWNMLMNLVKKTFIIIRDQGIIGYFRRVTNRLLHLAYHERGYIFTKVIPSDWAKVESKIPITYETISLDCLDEFVSLDIYERPFESLKTLCNDKRLFVARYQGKVIAGLHVDTGVTSLFDWPIPLRPNEACLRMSFTVPEFRNLNVISSLFCFVESCLVERNIGTLFGLVVTSNKPSLKAMYKVGYKNIGSVGYFEISNFQLYYCMALSLMAKTKTLFYFRRSK